MREANELLLALSGASSSATAGGGGGAGGAAASGAASPEMLASIDELNELGYECDASGCVLVLPGQRRRGESAGPGAAAAGDSLSSWDDAADGAPSLRRLLSGDGWKLGPLTTRPSASPVSASSPDFSCVVSGPAWSFLLTRSELASFLEVLQRLRAVVRNLEREGQWHAAGTEGGGGGGGGGGRPASRVKWAAGRFSCVATHADPPSGGFPSFSLDVALLTPDARLVQGTWPARAVSAACAALDGEGLGAPEAGGQRGGSLAPTAAMA